MFHLNAVCFGCGRNYIVLLLLRSPTPLLRGVGNIYFRSPLSSVVCFWFHVRFIDKIDDRVAVCFAIRNLEIGANLSTPKRCLLRLLLLHWSSPFRVWNYNNHRFQIHVMMIIKHVAGDVGRVSSDSDWGIETDGWWWRRRSCHLSRARAQEGWRSL